MISILNNHTSYYLHLTYEDVAGLIQLILPAEIETRLMAKKDKVKYDLVSLVTSTFFVVL